MSFWEAQRAIDTAGLVDNMSRIGSQIAENRAIAQAEKQFREGYARALEEGKRTGVMPEKYQRVVAEDHMGKQVGIKVVALRELGKLNPAHPLVSSATVRANIGTQTLINYNRASRPQDGDYNDFAPDDALAQKIYKFTLEP